MERSMRIAATPDHIVSVAEPKHRGGAEHNLARAGLVDQSPAALGRGSRLGEALDLLAGGRIWGVPIVEGDRYVGCVTVASVVAQLLPVQPDSLAPGAGLAWLPIETSTLRQRLDERARMPADACLDLSVPTVRVSTSPAHLLLMLSRRAPLVAVLDDDADKLLGVASWDSALRSLRSAA
jgi:hypothetical protein